LRVFSITGVFVPLSASRLVVCRERSEHHDWSEERGSGRWLYSLGRPDEGENKYRPVKKSNSVNIAAELLHRSVLGIREILVRTLIRTSD
jgi:hypothetical protein